MFWGYWEMLGHLDIGILWISGQCLRMSREPVASVTFVLKNLESKKLLMFGILTSELLNK